MTTTTTPIRARVEAERLVASGDHPRAALAIEQALLSAPPEHRPELEDARSWLDDVAPPPRQSWVGEA